MTSLRDWRQSWRLCFVDHRTFNLQPHLCLMADTPSPSPPDIEDLEILVSDVFSRVWGEFNTADTVYCGATIGSLAASSVDKDNIPATKSENATALPSNTSHPGSPELCAATSVSGYLEPKVPRVCTEIGIPTLKLPPAVEPHPEYESWVPTNTSIFRGDDSDDMQFFPFADEPAFDKQAYSKFFKTFAWQGGEQMDPDREPPTV